MGYTVRTFHGMFCAYLGKMQVRCDSLGKGHESTGPTLLFYIYVTHLNIRKLILARVYFSVSPY
jgi:hypothetical protein